MVTARTGSNDLTTLGRKTTKEIFALWGRKDIVLTTYVRTLNDNGRLTVISSSSSTITGDLQYVTKQDKQWIDLGMAKIGDGIFYTSYDVTVTAQDKITVGGETWDLSKQVEGETINGNLDYQAWIATRIEED